MAQSLDKEIRRLLRDWPQMWTMDKLGLFLDAGNIHLCKQFGTTWVLCLTHPEHGTTGYVKLSKMTALCLDTFVAGRRKAPEAKP